MEHVSITIIGAGVIGLAIAANLSAKYEDVIVVEKKSSFGQETSSRNSEVIHAGLYYPENSLKSKLCIEGNSLMYDFCRANGVSHKKISKLVIARDGNEIDDLKIIYNHASNCGVKGLRLIYGEELNELEPDVKAKAALLSPDTGIIDSHEFMKALEYQSQKRNCFLLYNHDVTGIQFDGKTYSLKINDEYSFKTDVLINCAGLNSDRIAELCGIDLNSSFYKIYPCKGEYYSVNKKIQINHLIYPLPHKNLKGLGVHFTLDLNGKIKIGPNAYYVDEIDYSIDSRHQTEFYESAQKIIPCLEPSDILPDFSGIRPKLKIPGIPVADFIISHEISKNYPGLINLIGIESPGLTSALAIANHVARIVDEIKI